MTARRGPGLITGGRRRWQGSYGLILRRHRGQRLRAGGRAGARAHRSCLRLAVRMVSGRKGRFRQPRPTAWGGDFPLGWAAPPSNAGRRRLMATAPIPQGLGNRINSEAQGGTTAPARARSARSARAVRRRVRAERDREPVHAVRAAGRVAACPGRLFTAVAKTIIQVFQAKSVEVGSVGRGLHCCRPALFVLDRLQTMVPRLGVCSPTGLNAARERDSRKSPPPGFRHG